MPVERSADHPIFELAGNTITSFAAPDRGSDETALFRIDLPPGGGLPAHRHDHFDVFTVTAGGGTLYLNDETFDLAPGDAASIPTGALHWVEAGPDGARMIVTMIAGTKMIREADGIEVVPPWIG